MDQPSKKVSETRALTLVVRESDDSWRLMDRGPDGTVELVGVPLSLDTVYARTAGLPA